MSADLAAVLLDSLDDAALAKLAERLAPLLAERLGTGSPTADRWLRGAPVIAAYIGAPTSRVYALSAAGRLPVERDGSALVARASELDAWLRAGGARRP